MKHVFVIYRKFNKETKEMAKALAIAENREDAFKISMEIKRTLEIRQKDIKIKMAVLNTVYPLGITQNDTVLITGEKK